ncbi:hypothetical protein I0E51_14445 [Pseudomonas lalucatii]|nr:hypothetical protein [Pseudomonas lalucatii]
MQAEPELFQQQVGACLEQGFKRIKICVEPWWQDSAKAIGNLQRLREFVGPEVELMLDVAMEFTRFEQLEPFLGTLQALDFKWIEAPFDADNLDDHRRLRAVTSIPLGWATLASPPARSSSLIWRPMHSTSPSRTSPCSVASPRP